MSKLALLGLACRSAGGICEDHAMEQPAATAGFEIERGAVGGERTDDVLRLLHLDLLTRGAGAAELGGWLWGSHWFPHLRHRPELAALVDALPPRWRTGTLCDPQIILQFPHVGPKPEVTFHVDREPDWAQGRRYLRIVGIALSPWRRENGGLLVKPEQQDALPIELDAGDAVRMTPDLAHSGGVNLTGQIRYGVYLRWLGQAP